MEPVALKEFSLQELEAWITGLGEPAYRARQVRDWIYRKRARSFEEMTNLPAALRERLSESARLWSLEPVEKLRGKVDSSTKYLFKLEDGETVESVLMPMESHSTLCLSSQVGCAMGCFFCETGRWGFRRNLRQEEILDQALFLMNELPPESRTNIVFMGMGEPLQNYDAMLGALRIMNAEGGLAMGGRRITVSTVGMPKRIRQLAREKDVKVGLALSLITPDEDVRRTLIPGQATQRIRELMDAAEYFAEQRNRRVTLEIVLFAGVNDRPRDAQRLRELTQGKPFKVNLIPYNPGDKAIEMLLPGFKSTMELKRPTPAQVERFVGRLLPVVPAVTVRWSQGTEVGGGCGQLRGRTLEGS